MPKSTRKTWVYAPRKPIPPKVPDALKHEVETRSNALVESVLTPQHVQPPPQDPQFNYIDNLYTKWYHSYFYFCARYIVSGPDAIVPFFEQKFARLAYAGDGRFNLSYMRYTGQWVEVYEALSLDECLAAIRDDPTFQP